MSKQVMDLFEDVPEIDEQTFLVLLQSNKWYPSAAKRYDDRFEYLLERFVKGVMVSYRFVLPFSELRKRGLRELTWKKYERRGLKLFGLNI